jgi:hypothetical protein
VQIDFSFFLKKGVEVKTSSLYLKKLRFVWCAGKISYSCVFCEIELIPVKFLHDSCKNPVPK